MDIIKVLKKNLVYRKLLDHGMFSEKLTKIFSSEDYGRWVRKNGINIYKTKEFSSIRFHLTRNNNAPRILEIPHPIAYYRLCTSIKENWKEIVERIGEIEDYSERSMIIPKPNNLNNRLVSMMAYDSNKNEKFLLLDKSFNAKYFVHADIANCYPSIYSHSIPWALVGHQTAKDNMNDQNKWFNKLDYAIRSMQRNETVGIPIGPDTSSLISELVLTRIDKELSDYKYVRYIDDYKCYCESKDEADNFLRKLSKELEKYHLRINPKKTEIRELPISLDQEWVRELKAFANKFLFESELNKFKINAISEFIDLSLELAKKYPGDSPIRYAVKILSNKKYIGNATFAFVIMYLARVCFVYPYFIDVFDNLLGENTLGKARRSLVSKEINAIVHEHKKHSRSDVSLWGVYLAIQYKFKIDDFENYSDEIINNRDCLPALMCYLYSKKKKLDTYKYYNVIPDIIKEKLEDEWWLYIYTLYFDNPKKEKIKKIRYKEFYEDLRKDKVSFLK